VSLLDVFKNLARPVAAPLVRRLRLARRARELMRQAEGVTDYDTLFDLVMAAPDFAPLQHRVEFTHLMRAAAARSPQVVVEIGSFAGGTGFLLSRAARPDACLVMVDDQFNAARRAALERFAQPGQRVVCLLGNSQTETMKRRVLAATGNRSVDVLFIDGDHRYEGVSRDFALYSPLVRSGGLIAFHDILSDKRTRRGGDTTGDAGGVPTFWRELRARYGRDAAEIVRDPEQDGCGIGMLYWRP
jgi:predicted O-methyltransferase YrrM